MTVAELVAKLGLDMKRADWDTAQKTLDGLQKKTQETVKEFDNLKKGAQGLLEVLAVKKIVAGIESMISGTVEAAHETEELAATLGISTEKVQELGYAARAVGQQGLSVALRNLSRTAYAASEGGKEATAVFSKMGVRIRDTNGQLLPADRLLENVADGMQKIKNPTERMALSMKLFGRSGLDMIKVIKDGSEAMKAKYEKAHKMGIIMTEKMIEAADKEREAQKDVDSAVKSLTYSVVEKLLPGKTKMLQMTQTVVEWFQYLVKNTKIVEEGMVLLAVAMTALTIHGFYKLYLLLGPLGAAMLIFGAIMFLVIDDILTTLRGGESLGNRFVKWVGEIYDKFMLWESASSVVRAIMVPIKELVFWCKTALDFVNALVMAATGDFSGLKLVAGDVMAHFDKVAETFKDLGKAAMGTEWGKGNWGGFQSAGRQAEIAAYRKALAEGKTEADAQRLGLEASRSGLYADFSGKASVTPSATAAMAGAAMSASMTTGNMTVNQTINASPGQDAGDIGDAAAASFQDVHDDYTERAYSKLVPTLATVPGGG